MSISKVKHESIQKSEEEAKKILDFWLEQLNLNNDENTLAELQSMLLIFNVFSYNKLHIDENKHTYFYEFVKM